MVMIYTGKQLDEYAKKIGWFDVEPSSYSNIDKKRKAPVKKGISL